MARPERTNAHERLSFPFHQEGLCAPRRHRIRVLIRWHLESRPADEWNALREAATVLEVLKCAYTELSGLADANYGGGSDYHKMLKDKLEAAIKHLEPSWVASEYD